MTVTGRISPREFQEAEGVEDWRVLGDGASVFFRTESFSASTRLVQAIGTLDGIDAHPPAIDVRWRDRPGTMAVCSSSNVVDSAPAVASRSSSSEISAGLAITPYAHVTRSRFGRSQATISPPALPSN